MQCMLRELSFPCVMWCNDGKHQLPFEHCSQTTLGQDSLWVGDFFGTLGAADLVADFDATERQVDKVEHAPTGGCLVLVSVSGRASTGSRASHSQN